MSRVTAKTSIGARNFTDEKLYCDVCRKRFKLILQVDTYLTCYRCLADTLEIYFKLSPEDHVEISSYEDVLYAIRKESIKRERSKFNLRMRFEILTRDNFKCVVCGKSAQDEKLEIDHIKPVSKGGRTLKENLRTLCFSCNRGKSNSYAID